MLGCTHYPLLIPLIADFMGPGVTLIDAGARCAGQAARLLAEQDALAPPEGEGSCHYYVSDAVEDFARLASIFMQEDVSAEVRRVDIQAF
ncbi:Glutamate racemase [bioreactor metagenome]|uniref:Glutamate racemase n=1 Tax=bioreactor metagenome TaxID=1076179 RepID=A0A645IND5_9ZZZZ